MISVQCLTCTEMLVRILYFGLTLMIIMCCTVQGTTGLDTVAYWYNIVKLFFVST